MSEPIQSMAKALPVCAPQQLPERNQEQRWLVEGLWPVAGVGIVGGQPKSLETYVVLELSVSIATATPCLGAFRCVQPGYVLVYAAEDSLVDLRQRLVGLCSARQLPLKRLNLGIITADRLELDRDEDVRRLEATLQATKPRLLVLDPFVRLHRGVDENSASEVSAILGTLRRLQRQFQTAIALVHHTRKKTGGRPGQALRGSGDFHAWADVGLYLHGRSADRVQLTVEHRSAPSLEPLTIMLADGPEAEGVHLQLNSQPVDSGDDLQGRLLALLKHNGGALSQRQLRRLVKARNQSVAKALEQLQQQGAIEHTARGWHLIAEPNSSR